MKDQRFTEGFEKEPTTLFPSRFTSEELMKFLAVLRRSQRVKVSAKSLPRGSFPRATYPLISPLEDCMVGDEIRKLTDEFRFLS